MTSSYTKYSDSELMCLLKKGDHRAFDEIYERYWDVLLCSAVNVLKDRDACLDVLQEVLTWVWVNRARLEIRCIKAYLLTAVKFQIANYIRKEKVRQRYLDAAGELNTESFYEVDELEFKELRKMIVAFTESLPERCREVFHLSRNEHLSNKAIAEKLGITEKTVEVQITIALKKLRINMGKNIAPLLFFL